ncbi:MAG TPA: deoxyribodipyrimidine photo-lyase [Steroidobacteraceae bacterium]|jgi:deoxyribodipyrimidine photo-lyase
MSGGTIVWLRQDLRLRDNPALHAATSLAGAVIPVYIWSPEEEGDWPPGAASGAWLHHSLASLAQSLAERGSRLIIARGPALETLRALAEETSATAVYWNRRYEPAAVACSTRVESGLINDGLKAMSFNSALLMEPAEFLNQSGKPYQVYTAFMRALLHVLDPGPALPLPRTWRAPRHWPSGLSLTSLGLLPKIPWHETMLATWTPGERGAHARLKRFLDVAIGDYREARERPSERGTSSLSPHLHFGEIGPRQVWHALGAQGRNSAFLRELIWREFAHHLLYHFPHTPLQPLRPEFRKFPWKPSAHPLRAWQQGRTGIPMVDAGMRELWATGWMHNRVRMIVASLLVKNLLIPWQQGARWFWDTLVDADLANNTMNWQWVAGSGADAAPYFRIFNPVTQAKRFDPEGSYIRKWVPELGGLSGSYPPPIVDLQRSRERALDAYQEMRRV